MLHYFITLLFYLFYPQTRNKAMHWCLKARSIGWNWTFKCFVPQVFHPTFFFLFPCQDEKASGTEVRQSRDIKSPSNSPYLCTKMFVTARWKREIISFNAQQHIFQAFQSIAVLNALSPRWFITRMAALCLMSPSWSGSTLDLSFLERPNKEPLRRGGIFFQHMWQRKSDI